VAKLHGRQSFFSLQFLLGLGLLFWHASLVLGAASFGFGSCFLFLISLGVSLLRKQLLEVPSAL
jgi:hypothetical protein